MSKLTIKQLKDYKAAIEYYDKATYLSESYIIYIARGMTKLCINDTKSAYKDFQKAIQLEEEGSLDQLKEYQDYYQKKLEHQTVKMKSSTGESEELIDKEVSNSLNQYLSKRSTQISEPI